MSRKVLYSILLQVATALLVGGPTLTLWIPGQTPPARTQALFKGCLYNVGGSLWLIAQQLTGYTQDRTRTLAFSLGILIARSTFT